MKIRKTFWDGLMSPGVSSVHLLVTPIAFYFLFYAIGNGQGANLAVSSCFLVHQSIIKINNEVK